MSYNARPAAGATTIEISGRKLARWLRAGKLSALDRARLAVALQTGRARLIKLTCMQARQLTGATHYDVAAMRRAPRPPVNGNGRRVLYRRHLGDVEVDRIVAELGASRVMAALDRATKPAVAAP
jgi:hypothetical protein